MYFQTWNILFKIQDNAPNTPQEHYYKIRAIKDLIDKTAIRRQILQIVIKGGGLI